MATSPSIIRFIVRIFRVQREDEIERTEVVVAAANWLASAARARSSSYDSDRAAVHPNLSSDTVRGNANKSEQRRDS